MATLDPEVLMMAAVLLLLSSAGVEMNWLSNTQSLPPL
jgi:hypothetical protein